jgi:hypothetical protein
MQPKTSSMAVVRAQMLMSMNYGFFVLLCAPAGIE